MSINACLATLITLYIGVKSDGTNPTFALVSGCSLSLKIKQDLDLRRYFRDSSTVLSRAFNSLSSAFVYFTSKLDFR